MSAIHLIRKNDPKLPPIELVDRDLGLYRSGYWAVTLKKARSIIGGRIYFHRKQTQPSFFGGTIIDAQKVEEGEFAERILFTFRFEEACREFRTPHEGWAQEMKLTP